MVNHFDKMKQRPCYVTDLDSEIDSIMEWYTNRYFDMDAYFGITDTDGIQETEASEQTNNQYFDLNGRRMDSLPHKGLFIQRGRKYLIQR